MKEEVSNCIFCRIVTKELGSTVVFEDEEVVFFEDVNPKAKVHVLGIPKRHIKSLADVEDGDVELMGKLIVGVARVVEKLGVAKTGFRVITNSGSDAGPEVDHLHWHILGGEKLGALVGR